MRLHRLFLYLLALVSTASHACVTFTQYVKNANQAIENHELKYSLSQSVNNYAEVRGYYFDEADLQLFQYVPAPQTVIYLTVVNSPKHQHNLSPNACVMQVSAVIDADNNGRYKMTADRIVTMASYASGIVSNQFDRDGFINRVQFLFNKDIAVFFENQSSYIGHPKQEYSYSMSGINATNYHFRLFPSRIDKRRVGSLELLIYIADPNS